MGGDRLRVALLIVGVLNLALFGAIACGADKDAPVAQGDLEALTDRVIRLEAWRAAQESINRSMQEHATSVGSSLTKQAEAIRLMNEVLQDLLQKLK